MRTANLKLGVHDAPDGANATCEITVILIVRHFQNSAIHLHFRASQATIAKTSSEHKSTFAPEDILRSGLPRQMDSQKLDDLLRPMLLPDLRIECRARGISPAGGRPALLERVREHMQQTGNYTLTGGHHSASTNGNGNAGNNYSRPEGQNVGNFLTDKNTSRVLAPPGGKSSFSFGGDDNVSPAKSAQSVEPKTSPVKEAPFASNAAPYANGTTPEKHLEPSSKSTSPTIPAAHGGHNNNYHRSEGQNVGNFLTDRNSSRVLAPPGGRSNITFG